MINTYLVNSMFYKQLISPAKLEIVTREKMHLFLKYEEKIKRTPIQEFNTESLYVYESPKFINGSCSLENKTEPYNLQKVLKEKNETNTRYLAFLNKAIQQVYKDTKVGWVGVYKKYALEHGNVLVKMAYRGIPSRAEFPLYLPNFVSNNTKVGLSGEAILINNMEAFFSKGGEYYECDAAVQSELCLPIFNENGSEIIGILDAEDHQKYFFTETNVMEMIALCINLSKLL